MPVTMRNRRPMHIKLFRKLFYSAYEIQVGGWRNCVATNFSFFYTEADRIRCLAIVIKYPQAGGMKLETSLFCFYVYLLIISARNWIHINWHSLTQHTHTDTQMPPRASQPCVGSCPMSPSAIIQFHYAS